MKARRIVALLTLTLTMLIAAAGYAEARQPARNYWKVPRCLLPTGCLNPGGQLVPAGHPAAWTRSARYR